MAGGVALPQLSRQRHRVAGRGGANLNGVKDQDIKVLCDIDAKHLQKAAEKFPEAQTCADYREVLEDAEQDWWGMRQQMKSSRRPFVSPDDFAAEMSAGVASDALAFTAGADEAFVIGKYRTGFLDAFTQHTTRQQVGGGMGFAVLGWGDAEAAVLVRAIAYAVRHCEFEEGAAPVELKLNRNEFGAEAKAAIRGACGGKIELGHI